MTESVPQLPPLSQVAIAARLRTVTATPPPPTAGSPPFDHALVNWLLAITPLGADVLNTNLTLLPLTAAPWIDVEPSMRMTTDVDSQGRRRHRSEATTEAYRPERLPQQAPRAAQRAREERVAEAWWRAHALCLALHHAGVGPRSTERRSLALAETALWLAGGATREPGVPIAAQLPLAPSSRLGDRTESLLEGPRWGRNGSNVLRIECAASHDLAAVPLAQLSRAQGWRDHVDASGAPGPSSSAKRAVREGRRLLNTLGAWPWAHADRGRLHEHGEWWAAERFLGPLRAWIGHSWARLLVNEMLRQREALALERAAPSASGRALEVVAETVAQVVVALDMERLAAALASIQAREP